MIDKLVSLTEAMQKVPDGALLALGGNTLNRAPMSAVAELARLGKRALRLVKTAGAMDVDLLCFAGCVSSVDAGFIGYESKFSLCPHYRKQVEQGEVKANEHACYTVISALRAAAYGLPFMPVKGLVESDLLQESDIFARVRDPFSGQELSAVRAIRPDIAILHVHRADEIGNALIEGPCYDDLLMAKAAKQVIVTTEELVPTGLFERSTQKAQIPHFLVSAVVLVTGGASPCSCFDKYPVYEPEIESFLKLTDKADLLEWLSR